MPHEFQSIIPEANQLAAEILQAYQTTNEFYREIQYRENFENHCQWYYATAKQHQEELEKMRGDINIFGWFRRASSR